MRKMQGAENAGEGSVDVRGRTNISSNTIVCFSSYSLPKLSCCSAVECPLCTTFAGGLENK